MPWALAASLAVAQVEPPAAVPPPSEWDLRQGESAAQPEEKSLVGQILRTLLALAFVVGLIFLAGRYAMAKLNGGKLPTRQGDIVKVVERIALDGRHGLFLIDVAHKRYLLGSGDKGLSVLTEIERG
jgi:flagellar biogenesis protein FliO